MELRSDASSVISFPSVTCTHAQAHIHAHILMFLITSLLYFVAITDLKFWMTFLCFFPEGSLIDISLYFLFMPLWYLTF